MPQLPPFQKDRYDLLEHIGSGGMADVYVAQDKVLGRRIVLKHLKRHLGAQEKFVTMFLDEARTVAKLNHPNIISIYDLGIYEDDVFMAMEWLEGWDMRNVIEALDEMDDTIDIGVALKLLGDTCLGLQAAHTARTEDGIHLQLVHRDISPHNLFVTTDGVLKLLDFGIAKTALRRTRTAVGKLRGKFAYMSPEQLDGQHIDHRSDLFSLGIILHELVTGRTLFGGLSPNDTYRAVCKEPIPTPTRIDERVPEPVVRLTMRALERDPAGRFQSAEEMGDAIGQAMHALPKAPPSVTSYVNGLFGPDLKLNERTTVMSRERRLTGPIGRVDEDDILELSDEDSWVDDTNNEPIHLPPATVSEDASDVDIPPTRRPSQLDIAAPSEPEIPPPRGATEVLPEVGDSRSARRSSRVWLFILLGIVLTAAAVGGYSARRWLSMRKTKTPPKQEKPTAPPKR